MMEMAFGKTPFENMEINQIIKIILSNQQIQIKEKFNISKEFLDVIT